MPSIKIKKLDTYDNELPLPQYETAQAAGADVRACLGKGESMVIAPGQRVLVRNKYSTLLLSISIRQDSSYLTYMEIQHFCC